MLFRSFRYQSRELPADGPHERVEEGCDRRLHVHESDEGSDDAVGVGDGLGSGV